MAIRTELRRNFSDYAAEVVSIYDRLDPVIGPDTPEPVHIPGYLDFGSVSLVFKLRNNPSIVAKLPVLDAPSAAKDEVEEYLKAYIPGLGVRRLEQVVAYNKSRVTAVLCKYVPGTLLDNMAEPKRDVIPESHLHGVLDTFETMQDRGLGIDGCIGNTICHGRRGVTFIDYLYRPEQTIAEKLTYFAGDEGLLYERPILKGLPPSALAFLGLCNERFGVATTEAIRAKWANIRDREAQGRRDFLTEG